MGTKSDAYRDGYERGLNGKSASTWGDAFADATVNEPGSSEIRYIGHGHGEIARMNIEAQQKAK